MQKSPTITFDSISLPDPLNPPTKKTRTPPITTSKMRNPFDMADLDSAVEQEEPQPFMDIHAYQSHDGNRSLIQPNESRHGSSMKDRFIGAIDTGTTSSRFIIFDCTGVPVAKYQMEFRQIHEKSG